MEEPSNRPRLDSRKPTSGPDDFWLARDVPKIRLLAWF
jgi:hypothetical protein